MRFTIEITDDRIASLLDAIAQVRLYPEQINGEPNPISKEDFATAILSNSLNAYVQNIYAGWISAAAKQVAHREAQAQVKTSIG